MSTDRELIQTKIFDRSMKFANDCGTQALGERDYNKISKIYREFAIDMQELVTEATHEADRKARIDEIERIVGGKLIGGAGSLIIPASVLLVRLKQLNKTKNKEEGAS